MDQGSAFLPRLPGVNGGDRYAGVLYTNTDRVYVYTMNYSGDPLATVQADVGRDLPPDSQPEPVVKASCEWEYRYQSQALAAVLGRDDPDGWFVVTYSTVNSNVDQSRITSVDIHVGHGLELFDISC
jgi:hypothetical protein